MKRPARLLLILLLSAAFGPAKASAGLPELPWELLIQQDNAPTYRIRLTETGDRVEVEFARVGDSAAQSTKKDLSRDVAQELTRLLDAPGAPLASWKDEAPCLTARRWRIRSTPKGKKPSSLWVCQNPKNVARLLDFQKAAQRVTQGNR